MNSFGPVLVAAVVANITMREFPGYQPVFQMPDFQAIANSVIILFIGLGILAGIIAPQYLWLLDFSKRMFQKSGLSLPVLIGLGVMLVCLISVWVRSVWGNGDSAGNSMLQERTRD